MAPSQNEGLLIPFPLAIGLQGLLSACNTTHPRSAAERLKEVLQKLRVFVSKWLGWNTIGYHPVLDKYTSYCGCVFLSSRYRLGEFSVAGRHHNPEWANLHCLDKVSQFVYTNTLQWVLRNNVFQLQLSPTLRTALCAVVAHAYSSVDVTGRMGPS